MQGISGGTVDSRDSESPRNPHQASIMADAGGFKSKVKQGICAAPTGKNYVQTRQEGLEIEFLRTSVAPCRPYRRRMPRYDIRWAAVTARAAVRRWRDGGPQTLSQRLRYRASGHEKHQ